MSAAWSLYSWMKSSDTVRVRPNPYILETSNPQSIPVPTPPQDSAKGREIRYETKVIFSPVYVSTRRESSSSSSNDKSSNNKAQIQKNERLAITKDEMDDLRSRLESLLLTPRNGASAGRVIEEEAKEEEGVQEQHSIKQQQCEVVKIPTTTTAVSSSSGTITAAAAMAETKEEQRFGSFTKTIWVASSRAPETKKAVQVRRSYRLSAVVSREDSIPTRPISGDGK